MASLGTHYKPKAEDGLSNKETVFRGRNYRITILTERLIRLEFSKDGSFCDDTTNLVINRKFKTPKYKVEEDEKYLVISTSYFDLQYLKGTPFKGPLLAPDTNLKVKLVGTDKVWFLNQPEARNFKGTTSNLDDYPKSVKLENGLYSIDGFATLDDTNNLVIDSEGYLKKREDQDLDLYLFMYRRDFGLCLKDYFSLTGYPALLPRYALGIWWNRDRIYSQDDTINLLKTFNRNSIPLSVVLFNEFWHTKDFQNMNLNKSGYSFNNVLFPEPNKLINYLHDHGVRMGINIDPSEGIKPNDPVYNSFLKEIKPNENKVIPFNALDKPFMNLFINNIINPLMDLKVDFFWIDYQKDLQSIQSLDYYIMKNYAKNNETRGMLLSRNGMVAAHRYPVCYSGETKVSWETLKYLPFFNSSASNMGISWWSHDVGGFKDGTEDSELYLRSVEFATFSPIFRFSSKRGPYYKREPWLWDMKTYTIVKEYSILRHQLIPYLYSENYNYAHNGLPLVQPLYYLYPEIYDEPTYKNEYYFGSELFVSPITKPKDLVMNRSVEKIFLPEGTWYDLKSGKKFIGNKRYVTFYKDEDYPVFAKAGAIITFSILDNLNNINSPKKMEINVFPGKSNTYKLYEDDGFSNLYQEGYYTITSIDYNYMKNNYTLIIRPIEGKNGIIPKHRDYQIRFRNTKAAEVVEAYLDKELIVNTEVKVEDNDFIVCLKNIDTSKQLTINCKGNDIEIDAVRIINEDINSIISDLKIPTSLKEKIGAIFFSKEDISRKRILIRKLRKEGLNNVFIKMFIKLLEYIAEI